MEYRCILCGIPEDLCQFSQCTKDAHIIGIKLVESMKGKEHMFILTSPPYPNWYGIGEEEIEPLELE